MEVAEHLYEEYAEGFIALLTGLSDIVLFSAAIPHQGGTHHVNEREPKYWADIFAKHGFVCFDILRDRFWDDRRIGFPYRQNMLIFINKNNAAAMSTMKNAGFKPTANPRYLMHPELFKWKAIASDAYERSMYFKTRKLAVWILKKLGLFEFVRSIVKRPNNKAK